MTVDFWAVINCTLWPFCWNYLPRGLQVALSWTEHILPVPPPNSVPTVASATFFPKAKPAIVNLLYSVIPRYMAILMFRLKMFV